VSEPGARTSLVAACRRPRPGGIRPPVAAAVADGDLDEQGGNPQSVETAANAIQARALIAGG